MPNAEAWTIKPRCPPRSDQIELDPENQKNQSLAWFRTSRHVARKKHDIDAARTRETGHYTVIGGFGPTILSQKTGDPGRRLPGNVARPGRVGRTSEAHPVRGRSVTGCLS